MKQSLIIAMHEAKELSIKNKDVKYFVMNKERGRAKCYSEMIINNKIWFYEIFKEGYYPYCQFINGIEKRA